MEMLSYLILTILYLLASTIAVAFGAAAYSAAGFFGYLCMVCYGIDAFLKGRALNKGELAQGLHVVTKKTPVSPQA
ncbi:hypothetical protein EVAR_8962_1 [Eumeta japonica]|uniref:Uncharacterized protein n=1 Tax=Eumeta variegata TaxID=151549 RepID=A0A4C1WSS9_EUMVA|nr:hypothetical protein EVAR_8962_1 [Eumeta japonica]